MHFELMVEFNKNNAHTSLQPLQGAYLASENSTDKF